MTTRGRINLLLCCLLSGILVNLAVAWGSAIWSRPDWLTWTSLSDQESQAIWDQVAPSTWAQPLSRFDSAVRATSFGSSHDLLYASDGMHGIARLQNGWPFKCLEACGTREGDSDIVMIRAFEAPVGFTLGYVNRPWLPYGPRWTGMLINIFFYTAIMWLIVRVPIETRRRVRQWRALCEKCAYPTGESPVCTECGAAIKRRTAPKIAN